MWIDLMPVLMYLTIIGMLAMWAVIGFFILSKHCEDIVEVIFSILLDEPYENDGYVI